MSLTLYFLPLFDRTDWVAGSTHIVLLPKNVILGKECKENNCLTHRKWTFFLDWTFFLNNYDVRDRKPFPLQISLTVGKREKWEENNIIETTNTWWALVFPYKRSGFISMTPVNTILCKNKIISRQSSVKTFSNFTLYFISR